MKSKFGKVGIISLALVIALAGLGAAFAQWTETLTTEANVNTGCLQLKLTPDPIPCTDSEEDLGLEDVGKISCTQTGGGPEYDFTEFTIKVENGYPGYWGKCTFNIENTCTIPAKICKCCALEPVSPTMLPGWLFVDPDCICNADTNILKPGEKFEDRFIKVTIKDSAPECVGPIIFRATIKAVQWNAPCP